ncbi:uncharacterized protein BCR38DRAFT_508048 [Pseudomassariella vexata]|uniref:Uncharacterized protein n=1 Tax=Pseudomassariella vexata TaxID=1141098 RepID=A0A1Y2EC12_9PEZI|nr:uncharacterized protein BCR38DRAFT_508048 [Pseudomassariella vexata]ORY68844.1 hypothetical protein BCR38DRAFT_508048 [Pseudomassariella vexata]
MDSPWSNGQEPYLTSLKIKPTVIQMMSSLQGIGPKMVINIVVPMPSHGYKLASYITFFTTPSSKTVDENTLNAGRYNILMGAVAGLYIWLCVTQASHPTTHPSLADILVDNFANLIAGTSSSIFATLYDAENAVIISKITDTMKILSIFFLEAALLSVVGILILRTYSRDLDVIRPSLLSFQQ